ncbi:MAG: hypothetical protein Q8K98_08555 [Bacteroidota bacterium]|nr:hypothetical protein [Bacteroidota bacterium]
MDEKQKKKGGYSYHITDEQIERYKQIPIDQRLEWFEEWQEFIYNTLTPEQWETLQKFRRGEI